MSTQQNTLKYEDLVKIIESDPNNVYQELMIKEKNVLEAVNVIAKEKQKKDLRILSDIPIKDLYFKFVSSMKQIFFEDLLLIKSPLQIPPIFLEGTRKIYTGILIVSLSILMFFLFLSN